MEKLERVLSAEERARATVLRATEDASAIRTAALEEARRLESEIAAKSSQAVADLRESIVSDARAEAARIETEALREHEVVLDRAAARLDGVVASVVSSLQE